MWQSKCVELNELHIVKYRRIFQSIVYLLRYQPREVICEKDTNSLEWKKTGPFFRINLEDPDADHLYKGLTQYNPFGPKEDEYKEYQKIHFIRENVADIDPEVVDEYSVTVGKLYRWLLLAIELRIEDVKIRR